MKYKSTILLNLLFISELMPAQNHQYRNSKYKWEAVTPRVQINEQYKNEDAVIVDEKTNIEMVHDNTTPYNYYLEKRMRIRFQTEAGLKKYSTITLPESIDPVSDYSKLAIGKRDSLHRPKESFDFLLSFNARIIKPDGSVIEPLIEEHALIEVFTLSTIE